MYEDMCAMIDDNLHLMLRITSFFSSLDLIVCLNQSQFFYACILIM